MSLRSINKIVKHTTFIRKPMLVVRILRGYYNTIILKRDTLRSIELAITYQCQALCHKCYAMNLRRENTEYLTVGQIKEIVKQAKSLGVIHINITGGEPTLRNDIFEIVDACRPRQIMVSLVTNALSLTREKMRLLKKHGLNTIQISLDSSDPDIHDQLRGVPGCYDKVMAAAKWAREYGINLCYSTVLSTESTSNAGQTYKLCELAKKEKAFLLVCDSGAVGGWEDKEEKMMTCEQRNQVLEQLMLQPSARHHCMYNFRMKAGCPAGVEKIYITAYGDVTPCDLIHDSFGNVLNEDLRSIWERMRNHPIYVRKGFDCIRYLDEFKHRQERVLKISNINKLNVND